MADEKESDINSRIPPELLSIIFQFLPFSDLKHALLVCKRWRDDIISSIGTDDIKL